MAIAIAPVVFVIIGALTYALSTNAKAAELGRLTFACGLLVLAFELAKHVVQIG